jgi:hypothetical protein
MNALNLAQFFRGSSFLNCSGALKALKTNGDDHRPPLQLSDMSEPNENPRHYLWPWFVLAAVVLGVALAIVWMSFAIHREKQERDFNAPIPAGAK